MIAGEFYNRDELDTKFVISIIKWFVESFILYYSMLTLFGSLDLV